MTATQFSIEVGGLTIHVTRKPIKNMYLRVDAHTGEARISVPYGLSVEKIRAFAQLMAIGLQTAPNRQESVKYPNARQSLLSRISGGSLIQWTCNQDMVVMT